MLLASLLYPLLLSMLASLVYFLAGHVRYEWERLFTVTIRVTPNTDAYVWLQEWLHRHSQSEAGRQQTRRFLATVWGSRDFDDIGYIPDENEKVWFRWNGHCMFVLRARHATHQQHQSHAGGSEYYFILGIQRRIRASTNASVLFEFIQHIQTQYTGRNDKFTCVLFGSPDVRHCNAYFSDMARCNWFPYFVHLRPRGLDSVILERGLKQELLDDIKWFLANEPWYQERHIPWRRGYLLHGPPGCGKSSMVFAAASDLKLSVYIINLREDNMSDAILRSMFQRIPKRAIVLLEDVDASGVVVVSDEAPVPAATIGYRQAGITFSGLLNALDGVAAGEGRVMFLTTNHRSKLQPALLRAGRVDREFLFDLASASVAKKMYQRFFPQCNEEAAETFSLKNTGVSHSVVQEHLIQISRVH